MRHSTSEALKLWAWLIACLVALVASIALGLVTCWWFAATTAQLIGSGLAFVGLLVAYLRARHPGETLREQLRAFGLRLIGKRPDQSIPAGQAISGTYAFRDGSTPIRGLRNSPDLELQAQIDAIVRYLNDDVTRDIVGIFGRLDELKAASARAAGLATEKSTEAVQKAKADLDQLRRELDQSAALDLRWAIFGLYIATIGVALSYWA